MQVVYYFDGNALPVPKIRLEAENTTLLSCRSGQSSLEARDYKITARVQARALALTVL